MPKCHFKFKPTYCLTLGPYKCFTAPAFFIMALSYELGFLVAYLHSLSEEEKVIILNGFFLPCVRGDKIPQLFPPRV